MDNCVDAKVLRELIRLIALTYQLQNAHEVVSDRLSHLQTKIRQDSLTIISYCKSEEELDFLFPEITRIHNHDLAVLNSWQNNVDWMQTSSEERHLLTSSDNQFRSNSCR